MNELAVANTLVISQKKEWGESHGRISLVIAMFLACCQILGGIFMVIGLIGLFASS